MTKNTTTPTDQILRCYQLEHQEHYQKLVSELPEALRRDWVAFVEDTARKCLQRQPDNIVGTRLPDFDALRQAVREDEEEKAIQPGTHLVVAFSFGANFPFCGLAFQYLGAIWEELQKTHARFICLFPPESAAAGTDSGAVPTLVDAGARRAEHCGLRYPFPEEFKHFFQSLSWFPGYGNERAPEALTLPGTCIVSHEGVIKDLHIPGDVTRRLPPPAILDRLIRLNKTTEPSTDEHL